jgi:RimJ/RimL family protein N-acetyltransferase
LTQVVTENGGFAGTAAAFTVEGDREVSFWIARHAWGRGVATTALRQLVSREPIRPLFARAAAHNAGSIAVLERVGFTEVSRNVAYAPGLGREIEEIVFTMVPVLDGQ